jgi:hypothetical protein
MQQAFSRGRQHGTGIDCSKRRGRDEYRCEGDAEHGKIIAGRASCITTSTHGYEELLRREESCRNSKQRINLRFQPIEIRSLTRQQSVGVLPLGSHPLPSQVKLVH